MPTIPSMPKYGRTVADVRKYYEEKEASKDDLLTTALNEREAEEGQGIRG